MERNGQWPQQPWATKSPEVVPSPARSTQSPAQPGRGIAAPKTELPQVPLHKHPGTYPQPGRNWLQNTHRRNGRILVSEQFSVIIL